MQTAKLDGYRFEALDSWRGIAALFVCLLHFMWFGRFRILP